MPPHKKKAKKIKKPTKYDLLCNAVRQGSKEIIRQLLADNAPVNSQTDGFNNTPLHWSIINFKDIEIVKMLIENGANIYATNKYKQRALDIAVDKNNEEVILLLLSKGALTRADLLSIIIEVSQQKNDNIIKSLVRYGIEDKRFLSFAEAINLAINSKNPNMMNNFLPFCAPIFASKYFADYNDFTYVFSSIKKGNIEFIKELLHYGYDINTVNKFIGLSLLHAACMCQNQEIIQLLLDHGADVNVKVSMEFKWTIEKGDRLLEMNLLHRTSIYIAVLLCNITLTRLLLSNGVKFENEPYLLVNACQVTCKEIVHDLVLQGMDVNLTDNEGGSPLFYCVTPFNQIKDWEDNNPINDDLKSEIAELLLSHSADPNIATHKKKLTPLFAAIFHGCLKTVKVLLKSNVNVQHTDAHGNTALHLATLIPNRELMDILLEYNLDINNGNHEGFTPLHIAAEKENLEVVKVLMDNNASIHMSTVFGMTPFHWACIRQKKKSVIYFLENGIDVNIKDNEGKTALYVLAEDRLKVQSTPQSITEMAEILLDNNADVLAQDKAGITPIFAACISRNFLMLEIILKYVINRYPLNNIDDRVKMIYDDNDLLIKLKNISDRSELTKILPVNFFTKVFFTNQENQTLLHVAVKNVFLKAIEPLIVQYKIDVNLQDDLKRTALHVAINKPNQNIITSLLECGADINIKNKFDQTPVEYAIDVVNVAKKLSNSGGRFNDQCPIEKNCQEAYCSMLAYTDMINILKEHVRYLKINKSYINESNFKILSRDCCQ